MSLFRPKYFGQKLIFIVLIETLCISYDLGNIKQDIHFIKALLCWCNTGTFHKIFRRVAQFAPPPAIQLGFKKKKAIWSQEVCALVHLRKTDR